MARTVLPTIKVFPMIHGLVSQLSKDMLGGKQRRPNWKSSRRDPTKTVKGTDLTYGEARPATEDKQLPRGTTEVMRTVPHVSLIVEDKPSSSGQLTVNDQLDPGNSSKGSSDNRAVAHVRRWPWELKIAPKPVQRREPGGAIILPFSAKDPLRRNG